MGLLISARSWGSRTGTKPKFNQNHYETNDRETQ
jgi:hypothetical protein